MCKTFADRAKQLLFVNLYLEMKEGADSKHVSVPINSHPFLHSSTYAEAIALMVLVPYGVYPVYTGYTPPLILKRFVWI